MVDRISHTPPPGYKSGDDPAWQNLFSILSQYLYDPNHQATAKGMLEGLQDLIGQKTGPFASALTQLQSDLNSGASTGKLQADFAKLTQAQIPQFSDIDWQSGTSNTLSRLLQNNNFSSQEDNGLFEVLQLDRQASGSALGSQFYKDYDGNYANALSNYQDDPSSDNQMALRLQIQTLFNDDPL
jgi:hypothetical protein